MREYGVITPHFWIGKTGKELRGDPEAQLVALYLMTSPHSHMTGIFHCPILYISHETGIPYEGALRGLRRLIDRGFCEYEEASETVFVIKMALYQIGESLKDTDNRVLGLRKELLKIPDSPMKQRFIDIYNEAYCLGFKGKNDIKKIAPSKPLRSQEQEQEQEQDKEQDQDQEHYYVDSGTNVPSSTPLSGEVAKTRDNTPPKKPKKPEEPEPLTRQTWGAYCDAYYLRYGAEPVRNSTITGQLAQFVKRIGKDESPHVAAFYVHHNNQFYVTKMHSVGVMLSDAEKLRTEWATKRTVTNTQARQIDRKQSTAAVFDQLMQEQEDKQNVAH